MNNRRIIIMKPKDNVGTALEAIDPGDEVLIKREGELISIKARENIPFGFKIAIQNIPEGGNIIKYGELIGRAILPIYQGDLVHIHNVEGTRGRGDLID
jgi:altronate dehydratase small subunit